LLSLIPPFAVGVPEGKVLVSIDFWGSGRPGYFGSIGDEYSEPSNSGLDPVEDSK
jgi:hypothetical protein